MVKTCPARAVGEKLDPYNLPGTVGFWIRLSERHEEVILLPGTLPDTYQKSVRYLVRLGVAAYNPENYDSPAITAATESETARFMVREYRRQEDAERSGNTYTNRYDALIRLSELSLSRDMEEQGPELAKVIPIKSTGMAIIPVPREPIEIAATHLAGG